MAMAVAEALDVIGFVRSSDVCRRQYDHAQMVRTVDDTIILMDKLKKIIEGK